MKVIWRTYDFGWGVHWLWNDIYRGVEFHLGRLAFWIGWTEPKMKANGW